MVGGVDDVDVAAQHDDRAGGERRHRGGVDVEPESEQLFGASGEDLDGPMLESFVADNRGWLIEPRTEAGEPPVGGCEKDLDAVVDAVLEKEHMMFGLALGVLALRPPRPTPPPPPFAVLDRRCCLDEFSRRGTDSGDRAPRRRIRSRQHPAR